MISVDFNDLRTFLNYRTSSKNIDFFMLSGSVDFLRNELIGWQGILLSKYQSVDDAAILVFAIDHADWKDDDFSVFVDVMREFMRQLPAHIETKLG
ncbi:hypothetical protein QVO32_06070 [Bacteroides gallinaceum]|uniref:hypothetical protein n=1 Tax=Bacteroides gallinaceum TaxID=1462571 RepID=UPI0025AA45E6|nr:hypothetical protein [Bacteroides gallinaceum]MDN0078978.1 hypothetical protein [Bacteroides gallinaceum]